ncbi:MAG: ABC transporter substrate-binding protein [Anaerolineaceae bacterium]
MVTLPQPRSASRLRWGVFALLPLLLVACGDDSATPPTATGRANTTGTTGTTEASPVASATAAPQKGGTLVVSTASDPGQLNPAITTAGGTHFAAGSIYNGLVDLDKDFKPAPDLAESWTVSADGKSYTFKLVKGVKWHDGVPFTSADVKFTFEEVLLKFHARTKAGVEPVLAGIDTPDDLTVVFRFKTPYAPLLQQLNVIEAPIVAKHIYEGTDIQTNPANLKPVGTGPFRFVEYKKGQQLTLERNPDYFKPGLPYLDKLVFTIIPQDATRVLAFENNEVDYVVLPGSEVARFEKLQSVVVGRSAAGSGGSFCVSTIIPNQDKAPLDRVDVRLALNLAVDRPRMVKQILFDEGEAARGPIASTLWAFDKSLPAFEYSAQKANDALDKAGLKRGSGGTRFKLTAVVPTTQSRLMEILKENFTAVGVDLDLKLLEVNEANATVFMKRDFDLGFASYCNGPDPEIGVRRVYDSANIKAVLFSNGAAYRNPKVDDLFNQGVAEVSREKRIPIYATLQKALIADMPYLWLLETRNAYAIRPNLRGLRPWTSNLAEYAWIAK